MSVEIFESFGDMGKELASALWVGLTGEEINESEDLRDARKKTAVTSSLVEARASAVRNMLESETSISRIAVAQIQPLPGNLEHNYNLIVEAIAKAVETGSEILVLPELAVPGYMALDHFKDPDFIRKNVDSIQKIVEFTKGLEIIVVVGYARPEENPEKVDRKPYNSAAVIRDGKLIASADKTLLPDYDIHWENRYFKSASERKAIDVNGVRLGIEICEDVWDSQYTTKVTDELASLGVDLLINLSASPFNVGKNIVRHNLVSTKAKRHEIPFVYANMVGAQDGYEGEIVFDGRSLIVNKTGELVAAGKGFSEDLFVVDLHAAKEIALPNWTEVEELHEALVLGIRDYFKRNGFSRAYIGLSGGIDSAVTAALAVEALGSENVIGVTMPSHITSGETLDDALRLAARLGIRCDTRPIGSMYKAWFADARKNHGELKSITRQNIQARLRGMTLMEYTNQDREGLVISTGNKTEVALGYCTLYGDMCGGLAALGDVSKTNVYDIARFVNSKAGRELIPVTTIDRPPTAELEANQTDAKNLPADYPILSPLVDALVEESATQAELIAKLEAQGIDNAEQIVTRTARMIHIAEYKRRQMPPAIRVTEKAFGSGRRIPITGNGYIKGSK
ncbi:MAG: NAD+ synthase [Bdellovibrionota bacterium]